MVKRLAWYAILLTLLFLSLTSCKGSLTSNRSHKASPDWSRGLHVGVSSLNQPVALEIDEQGQVHLVWSTKTGLHYLQLNDRAEITMDKDLDIHSTRAFMLASSSWTERYYDPLVYPRKPQLLLSKQGNLHLAFVARRHSGDMDGLFHLLLRWDGTPLSEPTRLSPSEGGWRAIRCA